jgi:hypothetical protein
MDTDGTSPSPRRRRVAKPADGGGRAPIDHGVPVTATATTGAVRLEAVGPGAVAREHAEGLSRQEATLASLDLQIGAIGQLDAQEVSVSQGAIGAARAETIRLEVAALGAAMANQLHVRQSGVGTLLTTEARLEQAAVRTLLARDVVIERPSLVGFLLARRVSGDVRVLFDWRGALAFGAAFGLLARLGRGRR